MFNLFNRSELRPHSRLSTPNFGRISAPAARQMRVSVNSCIEEAFQPPSFCSEQRHKLGGHEQAVFRVRNLEVALRPQQNIVVFADVDHGTCRNFLAAEMASLERLEPQRIRRLEEAPIPADRAFFTGSRARLRSPVSAIVLAVPGRGTALVTLSASRNRLIFGQMK